MPDLFIYLIDKFDKYKLRIFITIFLLSFYSTGSKNISDLFTELEKIPILGVFVTNPFLNVYIIFFALIILVKIIELSTNIKIVKDNIKFLREQKEEIRNKNNKKKVVMDNSFNLFNDVSKKIVEINKFLLDLAILTMLFIILSNYLDSYSLLIIPVLFIVSAYLLYTLILIVHLNTKTKDLRKEFLEEILINSFISKKIIDKLEIKSEKTPI